MVINRKSVEIWDTVLTASPVDAKNGEAIRWSKLSQQMTEPVQITDDMFSEACDVMTEAETDLLIDKEGQLFTVGMFEEQYALYRVETLKFVELAQFNADGQYCSHRNLAIRADEKIEDFLHDHEQIVREISRSIYENNSWYAEKTALAEEILNSFKR